MKVTVVTATYNRSRLLAGAMRSVLSQSFRDFEYIVASDGSTDDTADVVREFARTDGRVRLVELPHVGSPASWSVLLSMAKGEYVAWLSDDDLWDRTFLSACVGAMDRSPGAAVVYADYRNIAGGRIAPAIDARSCNLTYDTLAHGCFISACMSLIRRECLERMRAGRGSYFDPAGGGVHADWTLFLGLYRTGRFVHVCYPLGTIRLHEKQDSVTTGVLELARRRLAVRRKYAGVPLLAALREAAELAAWGTYHRLRKKLHRPEQTFK